MDIKPPFGYRDIAPLGRNQKVRLLAPGEVPAFARALNSIPLVSHQCPKFRFGGRLGSLKTSMVGRVGIEPTTKGL